MKEKDWPTLYVDVDHTLILWSGAIGGDGKPNPAVVDQIVAWKRRPNTRVYVWSYGGRIHAENAVKFCGIEAYIDGCLAKPTMIIDDDVTFPHPRVPVKVP